MTAPEKARKQKLATPHSALDGADAHPVGVVGDHALIPLKLVPAYVAFVTFPEKNVPFLWRASQSASDALAARLHADPAAGAAEHVGHVHARAIEVFGRWGSKRALRRAPRLLRFARRQPRAAHARALRWLTCPES